jgi:hypothetical protein|tara:strand:+ start:481 stop:693 length:213 start_codon:yes stop_codon:yes gene_type:complete
MWKMLIIICAVGGQCLPFHEETNQVYKDQEECVALAQDKAEIMMSEAMQMRIPLSSIEGTCIEDPTSKPI